MTTETATYAYKWLIVGKRPANDPAIRNAEDAADLAVRAVELGLLEWNPDEMDYAVLLTEQRDEKLTFTELSSIHDPSVIEEIPILTAGDGENIFTAKYNLGSGVPATGWWPFGSSVLLDNAVEEAKAAFDEATWSYESLAEKADIPVFSEADAEAARENVRSTPGWEWAITREQAGETPYYSRDEDGYWFAVSVKQRRSRES